jgi:geranylgeranyl reductase family protein
MIHPLNDAYDFLIIGAGPAGLSAAIALLESGKGHSIALVDKKIPWTETVPCAEAVHKNKLESLVPLLDPEWIRTTIDGVIFISPKGHQVKFTKSGSGLIINRARMHKSLAERCAQGGVHCNLHARVKNLSRYENGFRTAEFEDGFSGTVQCKVVIDASGPGRKFARDENVVQGDFDLEPAIFALVNGLDYPAHYVQMFFGQYYAPGGYAWLFPRNAKTANVGLVTGRSFVRSLSLRKLLYRFMGNVFPGAEIISIHGGAIACGHSPGPFAVNNLFKAGDAASMVNPISRAGIVEAMEGGRLAAEAALKVINLNSEKEKFPYYKYYKREWEKKYGNNNLRLHKAKQAFSKISDTVFDRAASRLVKIPPEKLTMGRIFLTTLISNPLILWQMRGMITK